MKYLWILIVSTALILPPLMDAMSFSVFDLYYIVRVCSLMGFTLMSFQFLTVAPFPFLTKLFGKGVLIKLHRKSGTASWLLLMIHGVLYLGLKISWEGNLSFILPDESSVILGIAGLTLLTLIAVTAIYRKAMRLPYDSWKKLHRISYFIYPLLFAHSMLLGSTIMSVKAVKVQWIIMFVLVMVSWFRRILVFSRHPM